MSFCKMCWYDIKHGCLKNYKLLISPIIFEIIVLILFNKKIELFELGIAESGISLGDILFYNFGGMDKYVVNMDQAFVFPIIWMILFVLVLFATLSYPMNNLNGFGNKILVKGKSRISWWFSKCIWIVCCNIIYMGFIFLIVLTYCQIKKIPFCLNVNSEVQSIFFEINMTTELKAGVTLPVKELLLVMLVAIFIGLLQLFLSLWLKSIYSFLGVCTLMLVSAYFQTGAMVGNYAMLLRHDWINEGGMNWEMGIPVTVFLIIAVIIIGGIRFKKYNIIGQEEG